MVSPQHGLYDMASHAHTIGAICRGSRRLATSPRGRYPRLGDSPAWSHGEVGSGATGAVLCQRDHPLAGYGDQRGDARRWGLSAGVALDPGTAASALHPGNAPARRQSGGGGGGVTQTESLWSIGCPASECRAGPVWLYCGQRSGPWDR